MDLLTPFAAAHGVETVREVILVRAIGEHGEGWGECSTLSSPGYTDEFTDRAWKALRDDLVPRLLTRHLLDDAGYPVAHPMARAGLDTACLDLDLRAAGLSLRELLGGVATEVPTVAVVGICPSVDILISTVESHLSQGVAGVKLKVTPETGTGHLRLVRESWPNLPLAADANGSFGEDVDAVVAAEFDTLDLMYLEQPLAPGALDEMVVLAGRTVTPIALDETATSLAATSAAVDAGCGRVVNVKPARVGGVREAAEMVKLCERRGVDAFVGGMLESGVGRAAALAIASLIGCTLPTDLGPSRRYFASDVTPAIQTTRDGLVRLPDGPGIGVLPIEERLRATTVERVLLKGEQR